MVWSCIQKQRARPDEIIWKTGVQGNRGRSRPRKRREDQVKKDMHSKGLKIKDTYDRLKRRRRILTAHPDVREKVEDEEEKVYFFVYMFIYI